MDENNKATIWVEIIDKKLRFHFPIELKLQGYSDEDLKTFNVGEALVLDFADKKCKLVLGDYATSETETEIIVDVDYGVE